MVHRIACGLLMLAAVSSATANTIAVTEFFNQPIGEPGGRQWVELYNYGSEPVDLKGWRLECGGNSIGDFESGTIQPGDYAIVICHYNGLPRSQIKRVFETEWLAGRADPRVWVFLQNAPRLGMGGGEITLKNRQRKVAWQLYYRGDGQPGRATHFASDRFKLLTKFGKPGDPGVVRQGNDAGVTGGEFLGYEGNDKTKDPVAFESDVAGLQTGFDDLYGKDAPNGQAEPGVGSPLKGSYIKK